MQLGPSPCANMLKSRSGQFLISVDPPAKSLTFWGVVESPWISQKVEVYRSSPIAIKKKPPLGFPLKRATVQLFKHRRLEGKA